MNELSQKIFDEYQVRKTKKQKTRFIEMMQQEIPGLKVEKGGLFGSRNLIVGDSDTAKILITAHYDTCAKLPFPNFIMPKNPLLSVLYGVGLGALIGACFGVAAGLSFGLTEVFGGNALVAEILPRLVFIALFLLLFCGKPNPSTANDNTSGVILLTELARNLPADTALIFFDNEESGLLGSAFYKRKHKNAVRNQLVINADCIGDGENILFVLNKKARKAHGAAFERTFADENGKTVHFVNAEKAYYPSDQKHFPVAVAVCALKRGRLGLYMNRIHTKRDTVLDESNVEFIKNGILNLLSDLN